MIKGKKETEERKLLHLVLQCWTALDSLKITNYLHFREIKKNTSLYDNMHISL